MITEFRISSDEYFMNMAIVAALRGTCVRRKVGCILVNEHKDVLATGYNGVASGVPHCIHFPCEGASYPSGQGLDKCEAIHAEENALIKCRHPYEIHTAYVTASPCKRCTDKLLNTSCKNIIFLEEYPHPIAKERWESQGRIWTQFGIEHFRLIPNHYEQLKSVNRITL